MDFSLSEEQRMLKDSAARFVKKECQFEQRREQMRSPLGYSDEQWAQMAELGWLCIPFNEEYGGLGGSLVDVMVLLEELGKGLMVEPWLSTVILSGRLIEMLGTEQQKQEVITAVCSGQMKLALAYSEVGVRQQLAAISMEATPRADGFVLNGEKTLVLSAQAADQLLVVARTSGKAGDEQGLSVFLIDPNAEGITLSGYATVDGYRAANITFDNVQVSGSAVVGGVETSLNDVGLNNAFDSLQVVMNEAILAVGAEAVGVMDLLYQTTLEYTKIRKQFGVPIGKFQVLQHRLVDVFMQCEQSRSVLLMAVLHYVESVKESNKSISGLKVQIGKSGRQVGQEAIQLHGGMGMTDELDVGYYFKRLTCIDALFGNVDFHLERYATLV
ncbi:hypothetical protein A9Q81_09655 [Gammaproteobacteria bacterium 42_54_T18]|nr:hypothetical protein A9Q81_09655 [Gammaproteobacteria bacterium 42_54_T18]